MNLIDIDDADDIIIIIIVLAVSFTFCLLSQRVYTEVLESANWNKLDISEEFVLNVQVLSAVRFFPGTWSVATFLFVDLYRAFHQ